MSFETILQALERYKSLENELTVSYSSISNYRFCNRYHLFANIVRIIPLDEKPALTFGSAVHNFLRSYYSRQPLDLCLIAFIEEAQRIGSQIALYKDEAKENGDTNRSEYSVQFGFELMKKYVALHPLDTEYFETILKSNGKYCVEQGFCLELENGLVVGKIDLNGIRRHDNAPIVVEHKSTSRYLNDKYYVEFNPNLQMSLYLIASSIFLGKMPECVLINILRLKDYKRDKEEKDAKLFARIETSRTEAELDQDLSGVDFTLGQIRDSINTGSLRGFPKNAPYACHSKYGDCPYIPLCKCKDENLVNIMINCAYKKREFGITELFDEGDSKPAEELVKIDAISKKVLGVIETEEFVEHLKSSLGIENKEDTNNDGETV